MSARHYELTFTVEGLVHIGDGSVYGKKDYFLSPNGKIAVLDALRFVEGLSPKQLEAYCDFLQKGSNKGLQDFLEEDKALESLARECSAYGVDSRLARARRGSYQYFEVAQFVKDAYGCPYVPGSSIKGMLRTVVALNLVLERRKECVEFFDSAAARDGDGRKKADAKLMGELLWRDKVDSRDGEIARDIMRYVSVSDSDPLSTDDLVFAKKYDKFSTFDDARHKKVMGRISNEGAYREGNELNIYRECLRPGTKVKALLDVDEKIDDFLSPLGLDGEGLVALFKRSYELYSECFLRRFDLGEGQSGFSSSDGRCRHSVQSGPFAGTRCRNSAIGDTGYCRMHQDEANSGAQGAGSASATCYLGGGVDFDSKTIINALFESEAERLNEVSRILYSQFPTRIDCSRHGRLWNEVEEAGFSPRPMEADIDCRSGRLRRAKDDHRHWRDFDLGVSPHTLKLGIVGDKKYPMGKCSVEVREIR